LVVGLPKPPRPPKPVTQPLGPGWLILIDRAATAPMLFGVPIAVTHRPTFSADAVALTVFRYLLAELVMTVTLVVVLVPGLAAPAEPGVRVLAWTTKPVAETESTLPFAPPKPPLPNAPRLPVGRGRALKLGRGAPLGRVPPNPPPPNPPPNPPAPVHSPLTAALMVTVVAVTGPVADPVVDGLPMTVTQLPTVTSFAVTETVSVIGVLAVKVTVTCPEVGFWTSMVDPDTAAAVPVTPGKAAALLDGLGVLAACAGAAVGVLLVVPELPHAVAVSSTIPTPARAGVQRRCQLRPAAGAPLVIAPIMMGSHPCRCSFAA
jgi:hypothetical protein